MGDEVALNDEVGTHDSEIGSGRQQVERLWNDAAFCDRLIQTCQMRGVTPRSVMIAIGTSPKYHLLKAPNGRNTNIVMRIAKHLNVHPAYLMFGLSVGDEPPTPGPADGPAVDKAASAAQRIGMIGLVCSQYWMHSAIDAKAAESLGSVMLSEIAAITR